MLLATLWVCVFSTKNVSEDRCNYHPHTQHEYDKNCCICNVGGTCGVWHELSLPTMERCYWP